MMKKIVVVAVLLLAVIAAGAKTTPSPPTPSNRSASPPPPVATETPTPTPTPPKKRSALPPPPAAAETPPPPKNQSALPPPPIATETPTTPPNNQSALLPPPVAIEATPPKTRTASPPPPVAVGGPTNCSDVLVEFSKCLSYISSSPNNTTDLPSRQCCHEVSSEYFSGNTICICYLVQKPGLFGFPLNSTRILSLSSLCPIRDRGTRADFSLESLCSSIHTLPPLSSITVSARPTPRIPTAPVTTIPQISDPVDSSPPEMNFANFTQESAANSGTRGHADDESHTPTFQVLPAWRTYSVSKSGLNPAGFSFSLLILVMLLLTSSIDCQQCSS